MREQFAVNKVLSEMKKLNHRVCIVVFGADHTDGLINEFLRQAGDINIIVLSKF